MNVALITRSTLFTARGGDTIQVEETARHLAALGVEAQIFLSNEKIDYPKYDLLHFFNITRPADILRHAFRSRKPYVVTPIWIDYSVYDRQHRNGFAGSSFRFLSPPGVEYLKTIARWLKGNDKAPGLSYLVRGQRQGIREILDRAALLLTHSEAEYQELGKHFPKLPPHSHVPNGIDLDRFTLSPDIEREEDLVLCVARIEGIKNQLNLIRALNHTHYRLLLIGNPAPNQYAYYQACLKAAGENVRFINELPQEQLPAYYQRAGVHVLPSWYEACGLSSLEAAAMGCAVVITRNGFASSYFGDHAHYCDPGSPDSILQAVNDAARAPAPPALQELIQTNYTWKQAAHLTLHAYQKVLFSR